MEALRAPTQSAAHFHRFEETDTGRADTARAEAEPGAGHRIGVSQIEGGTLQRVRLKIHPVAFGLRIPQQEIVTAQRQYLLTQWVARARPNERGQVFFPAGERLRDRMKGFSMMYR